MKTCAALAATALVLGSGLRAAPQPAAPERAPSRASSPTVEGVLRELLAAYRTAPVAERVTVSVRQPPPPDRVGPAQHRTSVATVRVDRSGTEADRSLRADLGALSLYAHGDALIVVRSDDPSLCMKRPLVGPLSEEALAGILPATPLPQIALALGDDAAPSNLTPFTRSVRWELEPADGAAIVLHSRSTAGTARLRLDAVTHRLTALTFHAAAGAVLEINCEPIDPGDPRSWAIDPAGRRTVRALRDLGVPEAPFASGEPLPSLPLHDLATEPWDLEREFAIRAGVNPLRTPAPIILVLVLQHPADTAVDGVRGGNAADGVRTYLRRLRRLAAEHDSAEERGAVPFWRPVLVFDVEGFSRKALAAGAERWLETTPRVLTPFDEAEPACLWTGAGRPWLDRFVRGSEVVVAVIGPDAKLLGSFGAAPSDSRESIADRLSTLFAAHARPR